MRPGLGDIELAGLCKSYDGVTNVVDGVNLKIPDGASVDDPGHDPAAVPSASLWAALPLRASASRPR